MAEQVEYIINPDLGSVYDKLMSYPILVVDLETRSLDNMSNDTKILCVGYCGEKGKAFAIPIDNLDFHKKILTDRRRLAGHNIKFDARALYTYGIDISDYILHDSQIAGYSLFNGEFSLSLDSLSLHFLNHIKIKTGDFLYDGSGHKQSIEKAPLNMVMTYCCEDVDYTYRLVRFFEWLLSKPEYKHARKVYELEMQVLRVLIRMEVAGVKIDCPRLEFISKNLDKQLAPVIQELKDHLGGDVDPNSNKSVSEALFNKLKIHEKYPFLSLSRTKTGNISTSSLNLEKIKQEPAVRLLLEYRAITKLKSTYLDSLPGLISDKTGLLHASFNQTVTTTGRLSSSNPNLQNIPARTDSGKLIRSAFVSRWKNGKIMSADFSQAEIRILADLSKEQVFINLFRQGLDAHTACAAEIEGIPYDKVTKDIRRRYKTINFGLLYMMGPYKLSQELGTDLDTAEKYMNKYLGKFSKVKKFIDDTKLFILMNGYTETIYGRRRYLPGIPTGSIGLISSAIRQGVNHRIQGSNADITKLCMIAIDKRLRELSLNSRLIIQVHDELVFDVYPGEEDQLRTIVKEEMERDFLSTVPMVSDVGIGENWQEAH